MALLFYIDTVSVEATLTLYFCQMAYLGEQLCQTLLKYMHEYGRHDPDRLSL